ncbi:hypothetical protein PRIPAC_77781 [Pristionchus pacificus]|uniref:G protein-coupled receptor n=1 Tax=Pristionchus pacificus TaxID=54126 RepID=A0A2A6CPJ6_PRIPA|nr:hypothetical protein PRIPAC_77781 [Pristionchus pacificus]|eukprot:PDM80122.1 G protein-coupled receptor [Pristionchus pacificus]
MITSLAMAWAPAPVVVTVIRWAAQQLQPVRHKWILTNGISVSRHCEEKDQKKRGASRAFFAATPLLSTSELIHVLAQYHPNYDFQASAQSEMVIGAEISLPMFLSFAWFKYVILPLYGAIGTTSYLVNRLLATSLKMSDNSKKMHRQIMKALLFQAALPMCYLFCAVAFVARDLRFLDGIEDMSVLMYTSKISQLSSKSVL